MNLRSRTPGEKRFRYQSTIAIRSTSDDGLETHDICRLKDLRVASSSGAAYNLKKYSTVKMPTDTTSNYANSLTNGSWTEGTVSRSTATTLRMMKIISIRSFW